jgi:hypothetical protein
MSVSVTVLAFLATSQIARLVFEYVAKNRTIRFSELFDRIKQVDPAISKDGAQAALAQLKSVNLVGEKKVSDVEDFNTYYITADGLEASRKVGI